MLCNKILDNFEKVILQILRTSIFAGTTDNQLFRLFLHTMIFWLETYVIDTSAVSVSMLKVSAIKSENSQRNLQMFFMYGGGETYYKAYSSIISDLI